MTTFIDGAIDDIDERLQQLRDELARLEAARAALDGGRRTSRTRGSRPAARRAATSRAPRRRSRSTGNTRADQSVDLIRSRPGITVPEIAEALKIQPSYLYRVLPRLESEGQVRRDGRGWHATS